jgi:hypothetical protein
MSAETPIQANVMVRAWRWLKAFVWRHKVISALVMVYATWQVVMTPIVNPFASDAYTIRGRFPFDQGFTLSFRQYAYGSAPWFKRWCGFPFYEEGTCSGGAHWIEPKRVGENHYELKVYRDRYFFGLGGWKETTVFLPYLASAAADREMMKSMITSYAGDESSVCDGSKESLKEFRNKLFCTSQSRHKDFKAFNLPDGQPVKADERLINFWLESELVPMLEKQQQGVKP